MADLRILSVPQHPSCRIPFFRSSYSPVIMPPPCTKSPTLQPILHLFKIINAQWLQEALFCSVRFTDQTLSSQLSFCLHSKLPYREIQLAIQTNTQSFINKKRRFPLGGHSPGRLCTFSTEMSLSIFKVVTSKSYIDNNIPRCSIEMYSFCIHFSSGTGL